MENTKKLVLSGLFIALGVVLPMAFHSIPNAGSIFLPMHIPILLCGLLCGPLYGLGCGILTPIVSSLLTGMPPMAILPSMLCELAVYGLLSGLFMHILSFSNRLIQIYISLIASMIAGRIIYGILNALIFRFGAYSLNIWLASAFITAIPGIIIQLTVIPFILFVLQKSSFLSDLEK